MTAIERLAKKIGDVPGDTVIVVKSDSGEDRMIARSMYIAADCIAFVRAISNQGEWAEQRGPILDLLIDGDKARALAARIKEANVPA